MKTKKSIKISLGTAICIFIIVLLIIALAVMCLRYNKLNNSDAETNTNKNVVNNEKQDKEWISDEKGIKLKYPEEWTLKIGEDYMSKTIIEAPKKNKDDAAKIYIAVYRYFEKSSIYDILEEITRPEEGSEKEELNSEEKNIEISGLETAYKVQVITYDNGAQYKTKTLLCMNDSIVYEFVYTGETNEYEKYYKEFEKIMESVEIYNIQDEEKNDTESDFSEGSYILNKKNKYYLSPAKVEFDDGSFVISTEDFKVNGTYEISSENIKCSIENYSFNDNDPISLIHKNWEIIFKNIDTKKIEVKSNNCDEETEISITLSNLFYEGASFEVNDLDNKTED